MIRKRPGVCSHKSNIFDNGTSGLAMLIIIQNFAFTNCIVIISSNVQRFCKFDNIENIYCDVTEKFWYFIAISSMSGTHLCTKLIHELLHCWVWRLKCSLKKKEEIPYTMSPSFLAVCTKLGHFKKHFAKNERKFSDQSIRLTCLVVFSQSFLTFETDQFLFLAM